MEKNKNDQRSQHSDSKSNQPSGGKKRENPKKPSGNPLPNKPTTPEKPDENPDPVKPRPGEIEPEKNDPMRIDETPPIFNNK